MRTEDEVWEEIKRLRSRIKKKQIELGGENRDTCNKAIEQDITMMMALEWVLGDLDL